MRMLLATCMTSNWFTYNKWVYEKHFDAGG